MSDPVNHPSHYTDVVPGIECIDVTEHFDFLRGNAIKHLWRAGAKGNLRQDLEKARWYIDREIANLKATPSVTEGADDELLAAACDWTDYRKDYGVSSDPAIFQREHQAFLAGWQAGRHGDQSGVLR